jgi:hypothetical protein
MRKGNTKKEKSPIARRHSQGFKVLNMNTAIPSYIEKAGIVGAPLEFTWEGPQGHIGPVETVNKMFNLIGYKTTCGMLTQAAGIIGWGAWRLQDYTDVKPLLQMIDASFAFQVDSYYVDRNGLPTRKPKTDPPAESAIGKLQLLLWEGLNADRFWRSYFQPHDSAYHAAYLVRHIMPKKQRNIFNKWLEGMLARMKEVAPKPDEPPLKDASLLSRDDLDAYFARHRGVALPPQVLNIEIDYEPSRRIELVDRYLSELDWENNPFLRAPEEMKKLGFVGTPYHLAGE